LCSAIRFFALLNFVEKAAMRLSCIPIDLRSDLGLTSDPAPLRALPRIPFHRIAASAPRLDQIPDRRHPTSTFPQPDTTPSTLLRRRKKKGRTPLGALPGSPHR
jgi:hypothetical protein